MKDQKYLPDFIFEVSWEVCNKVGGIHTVLSSKALTMVKDWDERYILIGPDVWKGNGDNPEFTQDDELMSTYREKLSAKGIKIKTGRWNIPGNPVAILVDFTPLFTKKNEIFRDLWLRYKLDSLSGHWDYAEPALFGYAAGVIIESFYHIHVTYSDKIVAQFHEWMTGVGLLYLDEHVPQIGTIFTTHATAVGRAIAGNGLPLYARFTSYDADIEAKNFNIIAKHSLEKTSAQIADCFTTVSEITARECRQFLDKEPDVITPNGFDDFIVPDDFLFDEKREIARKKLLKVASALTREKFPDDALLVLQSGRYEFRNKGIDIFIKALASLAHQNNHKRVILAYLFIPAHCTGPRKDVVDNLEYPNSQIEGDKILTHYLQGANFDPVMQSLHQNLMNNIRTGNVRIIYSPVYMNGYDGIYNLNYYDILIGFDLTIFPSYYEPWGYTPMESLAFHIPTITSNLTGFGLSVMKTETGVKNGIEVISRDDNNDNETAERIANLILVFSEMDDVVVKSARTAAHKLAKQSHWKNSILAYKNAFHFALEKAEKRARLYEHDLSIREIGESRDTETQSISHPPVWRKIFVQLQLPAKLKALERIAGNLWWTWNSEAAELFSEVDAQLWESNKTNPLAMLDALTLDRRKQLEENKPFLKKLQNVNASFESYMKTPLKPSPSIAYFCMEYGLYAGLSLYSGGLGILAGDFLKQASDDCVNVTGIGLLYRNGYFRQEITMHGQQHSAEDIQKFSTQPLHPVYYSIDEWMKVSIAFPGRTVFAKVWKLQVGRVSLYLLDTDIPENKSDDRQITSQLYGGDRENRLKQELLLGIGGVRLLKLLDLTPDVYHFNEGHAAFAGMERLRLLIMEHHLSFDEAMEIVRSSTLFTTHTPVPAGHDVFSEEFMRAYLSHNTDLFNISWQRLMQLGKSGGNNIEEKFSMSTLAIKFSQEINSVSLAHRETSRTMFSDLWKGLTLEEINIGYVTNGVHWKTWTSPEWQELLESKAGNTGSGPGSPEFMKKAIAAIPDKLIWDTHIKCKTQLIEKIRSILKKQQKKPDAVYNSYDSLLSNISENTLIITFARRMVKYKRPLLLFKDRKRLETIVSKSESPVLFVFAGKAHPNDIEGQELIRNIIELSGWPEYQGKVLFLPNYDMELASYLVKGSDIWLNTPKMHSEASGTSGMKAAMNGVLNLSIPDGWWAEVSQENAGWTIPAYGKTESELSEDEAEVNRLYALLENSIIPMYFDRSEGGIPLKWIGMMKQAFTGIVPGFTASRMLDNYRENYYKPIEKRSRFMLKNDFYAAKELSAWKQKVLGQWDKINIVSSEMFDSANKPFPLGQEYSPRITIDKGELAAEDIGVEIVIISKRIHQTDPIHLISKTELKPILVSGNTVTYECRVCIKHSGVFEYGFRIFPKHSLLENRQDFFLQKWI